MISKTCVALYLHLRPHARLVVTGAGVFILLCFLVSSRLPIHDDITALMPTEPDALAEQFKLLRDAPFMQTMTVTVGKSGMPPGQLADTLAAALRGPEIPLVMTGPSIAFTPDTILRVCDLVPGLVDEHALNNIPGLLTDEAVAQALIRDKRMLLTPRGLALRGVIAQDPLNVCGTILLGLLPTAQPGGVRVESGHLLDSSGNYALLLAEPASAMSDSSAAGAVMDRFRQAVQQLPEGSEVLLAGGHRHTEANAAVIKDDLTRILPVSIALLALAFFIFVRSWRGLLMFFVPTASLAVAAVITALAYGSVSGIVLGFGSVLLGMTADYAIHVYFAVTSGRSVPEALHAVTNPLLAGALTTLAACLTFLTSRIPGIVQMSLFAVCGILTAVAFSLLVLPLCLRPAPAVSTPESKSSPSPRVFLLVSVWGLLLAGLMLLFIRIPVDGDIRALSYLPEDMRYDEQRTREIWGDLRERAMIVIKQDEPAVTPEDRLEKALQANDRVWTLLQSSEHILAKDAANSLQNGIVSLAPIFPSLKTQQSRSKNWREFWNGHGPTVLARLDAAASQHGFSENAFAPFASWINRIPPDINPTTLNALGFALPVHLLLRELPDSVLMYTLLPDTIRSEPNLAEKLEQHGARLISGQHFRDSLSTATKADLLRFGAFALISIVGILLFIFRSAGRFGLILLPIAGGLFAILGVLHVSGQTLNIFHAVALPLVMALSVDYGIFMVAILEGRLGTEARKGILLSGLTTLSSFACLLLARHPALFSLGLAVTTGMAAALLTALVLLPRLGTQPERRRRE